MVTALKQQARKLKSNLIVLYLSYKDPRVPWFAKVFTICVVAYAFSPIDLIPDFIPILGYLDDLIIVPLGIYLALKLIPPLVLEECRVKAEERMKEKKPVNWITGSIFIVIWVLVALWIALYFYKRFI
ncbi:YkvA family protein [Paenibacillus sp. GCM10027628]|uniref:YkvA family protein n=1 Tax=Paenibacillus sp. GCM10027628 TaxID=3273413 RepID=UPI0036293C96